MEKAGILFQLKKYQVWQILMSHSQNSLTWEYKVSNVFWPAVQTLHADMIRSTSKKIEQEMKP